MAEDSKVPLLIGGIAVVGVGYLLLKKQAPAPPPSAKDAINSAIDNGLKDVTHTVGGLLSTAWNADKGIVQSVWNFDKKVVGTVVSAPGDAWNYLFGGSKSDPGHYSDPVAVPVNPRVNQAPKSASLQAQIDKTLNINPFTGKRA